MEGIKCWRCPSIIDKLYIHQVEPQVHQQPFGTHLSKEGRIPNRNSIPFSTHSLELWWDAQEKSRSSLISAA